MSTGGGTAPRWSADGKEIFFIAPDRKKMAEPTALFPTDITAQAFKPQYTVSRDGRFLVNNLQPEEASASPITLILNWRP